MRTAVVVGFGYHVDIFCRKMNAHAATWRFFAYSATRSGIFRALLRVIAADALISFAGPAPHPILLAAARAARIPVFVIWAGSDVTRLLERPETLTQSLRSEFTHLAVAPWLADELKQAGIKAHYIPIIGVTPNTQAPIPHDKFEVLTYLPEPRRDFYGRPHVYEVAKKSPDVKFLIVGAGPRDSHAPPNIEFFGWLPDITHLLDRSAMLLRVPEHDGMSLIVLEALARGRYVAWKYLVPGVCQVRTPEDTLKYLSALHKDFAAGTLDQNKDGLNFIAQTYEESQVSAGVLQFLDERVSRNTSRVRGTQVAIFGLDIFATQVADLNNRLQTGWNAEVLQFETEYETIGSMYNLARSDVLYTVGTPVPNRATRFTLSLFKKPRVLHWVGTDIEIARRNPSIVRRMQNRLVTHLTEVDWEAEELQKLGISAQIAPLPPRFLCSNAIPPLPAEFTLLTYLPRSRTDFYGRRELEFLMRALAGLPVKFLIVGGGSVGAIADARVESVGWSYSLEGIYARSSALFRFTPRDGLSLMVLEALSFGRHVLWTKKFPFSRFVATAEAAAEGVRELFNRHTDGFLCPQTDAAEFIRTTYDRGRCLNRILNAWDRAYSSDKATNRRTTT